MAPLKIKGRKYENALKWLPLKQNLTSVMINFIGLLGLNFVFYSFYRSTISHCSLDKVMQPMCEQQTLSTNKHREMWRK